MSCFPVAMGVLHCVWCVPKAWSAKEVGEEATRRDPPNTSSNEWIVAEPQPRKDQWNGINWMPCPDDPDRVHWLLNCCP